MKDKRAVQITTDNSQVIATLSERVKELEDEVEDLKNYMQIKDNKIIELVTENNKLYVNGIGFTETMAEQSFEIKKLKKEMAENMIAYGEEMLKKDKEIELLIREREEKCRQAFKAGDYYRSGNNNDKHPKPLRWEEWKENNLNKRNNG